MRGGLPTKWSIVIIAAAFKRRIISLVERVRGQPCKPAVAIFSNGHRVSFDPFGSDLMFNQSAKDANKSPEPSRINPEAPPDLEPTKQPQLSEAPYTPYAEKPTIADAAYKPYAEEPSSPKQPYEPYKGM
jgi:hypothetical protein